MRRGVRRALVFDAKLTSNAKLSELKVSPCAGARIACSAPSLDNAARTRKKGGAQLWIRPFKCIRKGHSWDLPVRSTFSRKLRVLKIRLDASVQNA
jgi:hypothetical protein